MTKKTLPTLARSILLTPQRLAKIFSEQMKYMLNFLEIVFSTRTARRRTSSHQFRNCTVCAGIQCWKTAPENPPLNGLNKKNEGLGVAKPKVHLESNEDESSLLWLNWNNSLKTKISPQLYYILTASFCKCLIVVLLLSGVAQPVERLKG